MYGGGRTERLVLNCRAWLVRGFSSPSLPSPVAQRVGAVDVAAVCVPCCPQGGTVRDRGCRDLVPLASFLEAGTRRYGRQQCRRPPIGRVRRLDVDRAWDNWDYRDDGEFSRQHSACGLGQFCYEYRRV